MTTNFLITGMFRSGTTMLARMLHANKNIVCASDPFAPIFKSFRNTVLLANMQTVDPDSPLHDYYFDTQPRKTFDLIQSSSFDLPVSSEEINNLRDRIKKHCIPYSPLIIDFLFMLDGTTYSDIFHSCFSILNAAYPKKQPQAVGFKEVWVDEFAPHFLKISENTKIIHIVRDPRSVVASNFASGAAYPLLFLTRQWRKLASVAWLNSMTSENVKLVRFEDLISNTKNVAEEVCRFIGVDYDSDMEDSTTFKDGLGKKWKQNTSFRSKKAENNVTGLNVSSMNTWRSSLLPNTVALLEFLCSSEMDLLGYTPEQFHHKKSQELTKIDRNHSIPPIANWIVPYVDYNDEIEFDREIERYNVINSCEKISTQKKKYFSLNETIFDTFCSPHTRDV